MRPDGPGPPSGSSARWRSHRRTRSRRRGRACSLTNGRHRKDSTDRLELTRATGANLSPIWGLSLAPGLTELLTEPGAPLGSTVDDDGVTHTVELVDDPERCAAIGDAVAGHAVLIADGHHRYGVSRQYREERRAASGGRPGPYDLTMTYLGELVEEQLSVAAIHRLLDGLPAGRDWLEVLTPWFDTEPAGPATPELAASLVELDAMAFVEDDGTATLLRPRAERFEGVRNLDSVRLEHALTGVPHVLRYEPRVASVLAVLAGGGGPGGRPRAAGERGRDRAHRLRGRAHAAEVDVLHTQAADGPRRPPVRQLTDQVPLERSSAPRSPGPRCSAAVMSCWLMPVP